MNKEILRAPAMTFAGLAIGVLLTLLLKGQIDWMLSIFIAACYMVVSTIYWKWTQR